MWVCLFVAVCVLKTVTCYSGNAAASVYWGLSHGQERWAAVFHHGSRKTGTQLPADPQHQHEAANYQAEISRPPQICDGKTATIIPISCRAHFALIGWLESKTTPLSSPCRRTKCITLNHQCRKSGFYFSVKPPAAVWCCVEPPIMCICQHLPSW